MEKLVSLFDKLSKHNTLIRLLRSFSLGINEQLFNVAWDINLKFPFALLHNPLMVKENRTNS